MLDSTAQLRHAVARNNPATSWNVPRPALVGFLLTLPGYLWLSPATAALVSRPPGRADNGNYSASISLPTSPPPRSLDIS